MEMSFHLKSVGHWELKNYFHVKRVNGSIVSFPGHVGGGKLTWPGSKASGSTAS